MELKVSSLKPALSTSDSDSDPEEKEISEEDDDDRNHKHRRKGARSQSVEMDPYEPVLTRPYRKHKPFENGHLYRESDSATFEKGQTTRFEKRRGMNSFSRAPQIANQRITPNLLSGDCRGRGREPGVWFQRDLRFSSVDIVPQPIQQGSTAPSFFAGRGMPNASHAQSSSWAAFGMVPGVPNTGLDILHPHGLQGTLMAPLNPSIGMGIPRQRCRDFEERGFCLRGDMCPMEHGVNRIVVEDVQSLSQFNLPVSVPSAHLMGTVGGQGALPAVGPSGSLINCKALHKGGKPGMTEEGLGLNGALVGSSLAGGADVYDPDQPLWTSDHHETSAAVLGVNPRSVDETGALVDMKCDHGQVGLSDGNDIVHPIISSGAATESQGAMGRIGSSSNKAQAKEKIDSTVDALSHLDYEAKKGLDSSSSIECAFHHGKHIDSENTDPHMTELSFKSQSNIGRNMKKSSQKAIRTLFVNGIPQKDNKREALFSHFQKFGEIIDIYIPLNSDRAFVQFSKREEAEAALKAPDAVMGNRFIKLWWAKRDRITENGVSTGNNTQRHAAGVTPASVSSHVSVAYKGKESIQSAVHRSSVAAPPAPDNPKPVITNGPRALPPSQKKLESLEMLKEELRKKQEMLDQKRNEFRRQLDKLEKQGTVLKDEDQAAKRQKTGTVAESIKVETLSFGEPDITVSSPEPEAVPDSNSSANSAVLSCSNSASTMATPQPPVSKPSFRPLAPLGAPFNFNRYKLDNRPTAFKINPPIPTALANVDVLKEHFSAFGELVSVELEDEEGQNDADSSKLSARISFASRLSAERAFLNGKSWQGHILQFKWQLPSSSNKVGGVKENALTSKDVGVEEETLTARLQSSDTSVHPPAKDGTTINADATGSGEIENTEKCENDQEDLNVDEDSKSSSMLMSGEKQSE
nr:zinc finger CCCH domain-containing protein 41-like [Ipomoea batatas]